MPVEIVILSGAQQGTRRVLDRSEFRVGCQPACDIKFDPQQDRSAVDREACFRLTDEGWTVSSTGLGEMFLNQQFLTRTQRVRSGDVLRMSNQGPDLAFNIILRAPTAAMDAGPTQRLVHESAVGPGDRPAPGAPPASVVPWRNGLTLPRAAPVAAAAGQDVPVGDRSAVAVRADSDAAAPQPAEPAVPVSAGQPGRLYQGLIGLGILVVIGLLLAQWHPGNHPTSGPLSSAVEKADVVPPVHAPEGLKAIEPISPLPAKKNVPDASPQSSDPVPSPAPSGPPREPEDLLKELLKGTVFLIELEFRDRRMPFANGVAVSDQLILTSAKQAVQLARWRKQGVADKIWAVDHGAEVRVEVQDVRVPGSFAAIPADSPDWIYCNLALLTVATKLPKHLALATPQDLEQLKEGETVYCLGSPHEGVPVSAKKLRPMLKECRIHFITVASELSSKPRLLHLKAELPQNLCGSPVVNEGGQLVGVYGQAAVAPEQGAPPDVLEMVKNLHYALVVGGAVMQEGRTGSPGEPWIAAESVPLSPSEAPR